MNVPYKKLHPAAQLSILNIRCNVQACICASVYGKGLNPRTRTRVLLLRVSICERAFFYNFILGQYFQYFAQRVCLKNNKVLAVVEIHLGARSPHQPSTPQIGCMRE